MEDFFARYADRIIQGAADACWEWSGARASKGYGHGHRNGRHFYAHRAAFESVNGSGSADGLVVRHRCDNPPCCNPGHLLSGTVADNCRDAIERGRLNPVHGERNNTTKMSETDVLAARRMAADGVPICEIARRFPVGHGAMTALVTGRTWAHLPGAIAAPSKAIGAGARPGQNAKMLSAEKVAAIKSRLRAGETNRPIAADYGVSHITISAIRHERIWSHVA